MRDKTLVTSLSSSQWLSMAEAALDVADPYWVYMKPEKKREYKDEMLFALMEAAVNNPVGAKYEHTDQEY